MQNAQGIGDTQVHSAICAPDSIPAVLAVPCHWIQVEHRKREWGWSHATSPLFKQSHWQLEQKQQLSSAAPWVSEQPFLGSLCSPPQPEEGPRKGGLNPASFNLACKPWQVGSHTSGSWPRKTSETHGSTQLCYMEHTNPTQQPQSRQTRAQNWAAWLYTLLCGEVDLTMRPEGSRKQSINVKKERKRRAAAPSLGLVDPSLACSHCGWAQIVLISQLRHLYQRWPAIGGSCFSFKDCFSPISCLFISISSFFM